MTLIIDVSCRGVDETRRLQLEEGEEILVGRDNRDVVLCKDQTLSRKHFLLRYSDRSIVVKHLSRTNPTLMAPDGSSDFRRITELKTEFKACRIIAGSHRFVATLECLESATISGDVNEIWSDFDDEVEVEEVNVASGNDANLETLVDLEERFGKPVFTWDDSVDENSEPPNIVEREEKPLKSRDVRPKGPVPEPLADPLEPEPQKNVPAPKPQREEPVKRAKDENQTDAFTDDFFD